MNAYGIAAVAGFVGLFSRQATDKLRELFDTLFKTDSTDEEVDPVIHVVSPDPAIVKGAEPVRLTIEGSGFVRLSQVRIDGHAVNPSSVGPTQIQVSVSPGESLRAARDRRGDGAQPRSECAVGRLHAPTGRRMSTPPPTDDHYWLVASRLIAGRVIPFLGAGANMCGRPGADLVAARRTVPAQRS